MNQEMLIRIEKLEDEIQDLSMKLANMTTAVLILIKRIDPEGYKESCVDSNDDNVS